jgi:lipopolysaccharide/colanic/teichoic acid biosynthesis glycosyltransferase
MNSNIILTTLKVSTLDIDSLQRNRPTNFPLCQLKWRQSKIWVKKATREEYTLLPALKRRSWLTNCLKHSPIKQVCLDLSLEESAIQFWADAGKQAKKQVFLRIPSYSKFSGQANAVCWQIKRVFDWSAAALLLLLFSPIMLVIGLLIKLFSPGPILFRQWRVGKRGKLFQVFKFRTMVVDAEKQHHDLMRNQSGLHKLEDDPRITPIGKWLRKYSLDELPQLLNVLRGEMSLVGPRPWALYDALRLEGVGKQRLNALPGITGTWQIEARSYVLDLDAVTKYDLEYLHSWSLIQDLKILLLTIPKVVAGFGAY